MKKYLSYLLPSFAELLIFLVAPLVVGSYFALSTLSDQIMGSEDITRSAIHDDVLSRLYISGTLAAWFDKFMSVAFWGVLIAVVVMLAWGVSAAQASIANHVETEELENFRVSKQSWHGHYLVVSGIKILLLFVMVYSIASLVTTAVPQIAAGVSLCIQRLTVRHGLSLLYGVLLMVFFQILALAALRMFKHTRAD